MPHIFVCVSGEMMGCHRLPNREISSFDLSVNSDADSSHHNNFKTWSPTESCIGDENDAPNQRAMYRRQYAMSYFAKVGCGPKGTATGLR